MSHPVSRESWFSSLRYYNGYVWRNFRSNQRSGCTFVAGVKWGERGEGSRNNNRSIRTDTQGHRSWPLLCYFILLPCPIEVPDPILFRFSHPQKISRYFPTGNWQPYFAANVGQFGTSLRCYSDRDRIFSLCPHCYNFLKY